VGHPASGKSTWAHQNGAGAVHVSQDGLIDAITPDGFEHVYRSIYTAAEDAIALAALSAGHTVIVDRTNRTPLHRERWLRIARESASPAVAVWMTASPDVCHTRNASRKGQRRLSELRMERMMAAFQAPRRDEGFAAVFCRETTTLNEILATMKSCTEEGGTYEHGYQTR
jgi:predicted kinase